MTGIKFHVMIVAGPAAAVGFIGPPRRVFTLTEVVVVIAIIALLDALRADGRQLLGDTRR